MDSKSLTFTAFDSESWDATANGRLVGSISKHSTGLFAASVGSSFGPAKDRHTKSGFRSLHEAKCWIGALLGA